VALADDGGVILIVLQSREGAGHELARMLHQRSVAALGHHQVIRRKADLPRIERLDGERTLDGGLQVGIGRQFSHRKAVVVQARDGASNLRLRAPYGEKLGTLDEALGNALKK